MTSNIHMPNLNFILQAFLKIFSKCDDDAYHICDPSQLLVTQNCHNLELISFKNINNLLYPYKRNILYVEYQ